MFDSRKVAELILKRSEKWLDNAINTTGLDYGSNAFVYKTMLLETNIFFVHLYDREVFRLYGAGKRNDYLDKLLNVWPTLLASSLNPKHIASKDEVASIETLYNAREAEYGCLEVVNKAFVYCVVSFFAKYLYALLDKRANSLMIDFELRMCAVYGIHDFAADLLSNMIKSH